MIEVYTTPTKGEYSTLSKPQYETVHIFYKPANDQQQNISISRDSPK